MRKKKSFWLAIVLLLIVGIALGLRWGMNSQRLRRNWKNQTVVELARLSSDRDWVNTQVAVVQKQISTGTQGAWVGEHVVVMRDGQWVVFRNECNHWHQLLGDIFIGKASNGRWYYSSYHFCCQMIVPKMDDQPADLSTFARNYFLREFDGNSDEAISKTWDGQRIER